MVFMNVENLSYKYGNIQALNGINLSIKDENCIAIIGCNGAGKSTFVNSVTGLLKDWEGEVYFKGKSIKGLSTQALVKMGIVQCPERRFLFDYLSVKDNLMLGSYNAGKNPKIKIDVVFDLFPVLKERLNQQVYSLSGGESQMVAIGRSLLANPSLLILDEPTLGLAPIMSKKLIEAFNIIKTENNIKIILVEQNVKVSFDVAEQIYFIREGRLVRSAKPSDLKIDKEIQETFLGV